MSIREPELYCPSCSKGLPSIDNIDFCPFCGSALRIGVSQEIKEDEAMVWFEWMNGQPFMTQQRLDERYIIEVEGKQGLLAHMYYKCCFALSRGKHQISIISIYKGKETNKEIIDIEVPKKAKQVYFYLGSRHNDNDSPQFIETIDILPHMTRSSENYVPGVFMLPPKDYYQYVKIHRDETIVKKEIDKQNLSNQMKEENKAVSDIQRSIRIGECPNCHEMIREEANYCRKCGAINPLSK